MWSFVNPEFMEEVAKCIDMNLIRFAFMHLDNIMEMHWENAHQEKYSFGDDNKINHNCTEKKIDKANKNYSYSYVIRLFVFVFNSRFFIRFNWFASISKLTTLMSVSVVQRQNARHMAVVNPSQAQIPADACKMLLI